MSAFRRPSTRRMHPVGVAVAAVLASGLALAGCGGEDKPDRDVRSYVRPSGETTLPAAAAGTSPDDAVSVAPHPIDSPHRPNLLMITTDDAAWKNMQYMPHLQRLLADQGVTLENGLAPTPICVPARASLLSGQYAHNHGAGSIKGENGGVSAFNDADTLPVWLEQAGYRTMFVGKYLNGYGEEDDPHYVPPGWSDWHATVDPTTYNYVKPTLNIDGELHTYTEYSTTLLRDQSLELLRSADASDQPWYMWVNYVAPHFGGPAAPDDPSQVYPDDPDPVKTTTPEERDNNTFDHLPLSHDPDMFEADPSDKGIIRAARRTVSEQRRLEMTEANQQRVEALQAVDRALAATVRTLRRSGELDNTYLVFTSDNGYVLGEHNLEGKLWYFRDISSVPMYIRGPGLKSGTVSHAPVTNADWAPTFAALAGVRPAAGVDGMNVMPWIESKATSRVIPVEAYPVKGGTRRLYRGVIDGPWTWVKGRNGRVEVYNRTIDPFQLQNLAGDPRYAQQRAELKALADRYDDCAAQECRAPFTTTG